MICWVMYDIVNNKARNKTAKCCMQSGLHRVQYSVFLGSLESNEKDILELKIKELINEEKDSVYIFPMSKNELQDTVLLGQAFNKEYVTDQVKELFF